MQWWRSNVFSECKLSVTGNLLQAQLSYSTEETLCLTGQLKDHFLDGPDIWGLVSLGFFEVKLETWAVAFVIWDYVFGSDLSITFTIWPMSKKAVTERHRLTCFMEESFPD